MKNYRKDGLFIDLAINNQTGKVYNVVLGYEDQRLIIPIHKLFSLWLLVKEFCNYADKKRLLITKYKEKISIDNIK